MTGTSILATPSVITCGQLSWTESVVSKIGEKNAPKIQRRIGDNRKHYLLARTARTKRSRRDSVTEHVMSNIQEKNRSQNDPYILENCLLMRTTKIRVPRGGSRQGSAILQAQVVTSRSWTQWQELRSQGKVVRVTSRTKMTQVPTRAGRPARKW